MSGVNIPPAAIIAALKEAYLAVPMEQRTAYVMRRLNEWKREQEQRPIAEVVPFRKTSSGMVPFSEIADDPVIARLCAEDNR